MIPFNGIYLMLILAGSPTTPERIGLEQQLSMETCQQNAQKFAAEKKYSFIRCIYDGAIVSPALRDQRFSEAPPQPPQVNPGLNMLGAFLGMMQEIR